ncbi:hypothetical protein [Nostoc sp. ChiVER01]|uniref:hypothetical protein n=1 Tax=Nostoc sp. ChiVER01 TaxID=3075382 RepID=UPI002AD51248|nr:hypothetical protein [Nostoc sp. ChiVER01]MDZ8223992.1 hypothetical protein [Nostoc sp. ChiVER01]
MNKPQMIERSLKAYLSQIQLEYGNKDASKSKCVGWVEERNPIFCWVYWVSLRSAQPTNILN